MKKRPNILFLFNDHQTYYGHGKMSGGPKIHRSNFERLVKEGVEFTHAYTACPLCGPARRTLLTGLYPHKHLELMNDVNHPFDKQTYIEILHRGGYEVYYYGKWHAGPGTVHDLGGKGFCYPGFGNPLITKEYKDYLKKRNLPHFQTKIVRSFWDPNWPRLKDSNLQVGELYTPKGPEYNEGAFGIMTTPNDTHESFFLAKSAIEQLTKISESGNDQPFHMRVDFWGPHPPYFVSQEFLDLYDPKDIPIYPSFDSDLSGKPEIYKNDVYYPISKNGKLIYPNPLPWSEWQKVLAISYAHNTMIDHAGGLILEVLDKLGLAENTLVVWTLDHGDGLACHGGHFDKDCYMPQELIKIPLVVRYPEEIAPGQKRDELISSIDFAPTILDAAGLRFDSLVDGTSILPLCKGESIKWREEVVCQTHGHFHIHLGRAVVTERYKYVYNERDLDELYDLTKDPYELNNLIDDESSIPIIKDMKSRLAAWRQKTGDNFKKRVIRKIISS
ncbi:MAG: sulfatase-like hydrolase/transferase [Candidatus Lokiarchaeota archaeon]|nr:sulfatase-like hydrolase/transferase [Candidatus Lokiarchaeota archaeon]